MTRVEHDTFEEGRCPCGNGHILRHVESTDYRFSSVHISYSINCSACNRQWRIDHGTLVLRESEAPYLAARVESDSARSELHRLAQELVESYLKALTFKSKKAELEHLLALNLSASNYASYLKERRAGKVVHQLAYGLRNIPWLEERAQAGGRMAELTELLHNHEVTSKRLEVVSKQVVRRSLKSA